MSFYGIIPAAGAGRRMRMSEKKAFLMIDGESVVHRSCRLFYEHEGISAFLVMAPPDELDLMREEVQDFKQKILAVLPGGKTRTESVLRGLAWLSERIGPDESRKAQVLVHDAARCLCSEELISALIRQLEREFCASAPALPCRDAARLLDEDGSHSEALPKQRLRLIQTPQGAPLQLLLDGLTASQKEGRSAADELEALGPTGCPIRLIPGEEGNIKLTYPEDLWIARAILERKKGASPEPFIS